MNEDVLEAIYSVELCEFVLYSTSESGQVGEGKAAGSECSGSFRQAKYRHSARK